MRHRLFIVFLATVALAGCPSRRSADQSQNAPSQASTAVGNPQTVPESSTALDPVIPPQTQMKGANVPGVATPAVHVQLTEYAIEMPDTMTAGPHALTITNSGKVNHNFAIIGPGVSEKLASDLTRGDSTQMNVTLQKGIYTVYCPVDGHRAKGMQRIITVE